MQNYNLLNNNRTNDSNNKKNKKSLNYKRIGIVAALLLVAVIVGYALSDRPDSAGGRVAAAAGRVNEQVNDTRHDFQEIQDLALEAQAPSGVVQEPTSSAAQQQAPASDSIPGIPAGEQGAVNVVGIPGGGQAEGDQGDASAAPQQAPASDSIPGIPAGEQGAVNVVGIPGGGQAEGDQGDASAAPPATLTFNEKAREIQGDAPFTVHQEAAQRLVDSWQPQYEAAVQEHNSLMLRISETRALWQEYRDEQIMLINEMYDPDLGASMFTDLGSDVEAFEKWDQNAEHVEIRSNAAMLKLHDMDRVIQFQRNRADFRAVIGQSVGMSLQVTLLLDSLDTFEDRTNALSAAITSS